MSIKGLEAWMETWPRWDCPGCGEPMMDPSPKAVGNRCGDCEEAAVEAEAAARKLERANQVTTNRESVLLSIGVPADLARRTFKEPEAWPVDNRPGFDGVLLNSWSGRPSTVVLQGATGVGKTMLGVELLLRLFVTWRRARWIVAAQIPSMIYGPNSHEDREELLRTPALLVDELGRGHSGGGWEPLFEILSGRHAAGLPTIYTTQVPLDKFVEILDGAVFSRLREGLLVSMRGPDRRGAGRS